jgi:hypothetical protein
MWSHRNQSAHQNCDEDKAKAIALEVTVYYKHLQTLWTPAKLTYILGLLIQPEELIRVQDGSTAYKQDWLKNVQAAVSRDARKEQTSLSIQNMRNCMREFLGK